MEADYGELTSYIWAIAVLPVEAPRSHERPLFCDARTREVRKGQSRQ